jgi:hypothetical protein
VTLGDTRAQAERRYPSSSRDGRRYEDFFCLTPLGVRGGYASPKLLRILRPDTRGQFRGRVVWIATSNTHYAINGVRAGVGVARAGRSLRLAKVFVVGLNQWYLAPAGGATAILKVRHGVVQEIGLASARLTQNRAAQRKFLRSFY